MSFLYHFYMRNLVNRPIITNALTASASMALGDAIAQKIRGRSSIDTKEVARFAAAGLFVVGPGCRISYVLIDKLIGPTNSFSALMKKVCLDQGCGAVVIISTNITVLSLLEKRSLDLAIAEYQDSFLPIYKLNLLVWPWFQMINFSLIPLKLRVVAGSGMALVWNVVFSYAFNKKKSDNILQ